MKLLKKSVLILRYLGPRWICFRLRYALRRKTGGLVRRSPPADWPSVAVEAREVAPLFFASAIVPGPACVDQAEEILRGRFRQFSCHVIEAGFPPDWRLNQFTGERALEDQHWSLLGDFAFGDIKGIWELSRFSWAFCLARAFARTRDDRYANGFWVLFEDWMSRNPPNQGANWMCGQEATFRMMAATFARQVCADAPATTAGRCARFRGFALVTGRRIAANLDYALSQKNNHGVSECVGLITAAMLAPEHAESAAWLEGGLRNLEKQLNELVYEDGGFAQHSLVYQRVLLHDLCWCRFRLACAGQAIPKWLDTAGTKALGLLMALVDPATGQGPLYGANDGSNILPLADADFLDFRPVVQAASALFQGTLPLPEGTWDEAAAWLAPDWTNLPRVGWSVVPVRWHARESGFFQLTHGTDRLVLRCPEIFRHRPSQADMLHVDVWNKNRPVTRDGGSFSYNSTERFATLGNAAQHNVLTVDGQEPMQKFNRFLYLPWPKGTATDDAAGSFLATHDGYADKGVCWTRDVSLRTGGGFIVRDRVAGADGHRLAWHWRLADWSWQMGPGGDMIVVCEAGWSYTVRWHGLPDCQSKLIRADKATAFGWWSPTYSAIEPAYSLRIETEATGEVELMTEFFPVD